MAMLNECGVKGISSSADNVVSAHVVGSDNSHRELKANAYSSVCQEAEPLAARRGVRTSQEVC